MKKRLLSLLLVVMIMASIIPNIVLAEDTITVYVTAVQNGEFINGKNDTQIAYLPIEIESNESTIENAFIKLHEDYYEGENGYGSGSGYVNTFWGQPASFSGYYYNNGYAMGTGDVVSDGGHIVFWFYQDLTNWSDKYLAFTELNKNIQAGEPLSLTLNDYAYTGTVPYAQAQITVNGVELIGKETDSDGKAVLYFADEGEYIVSAVSKDYIVPPVMKVTVTGNDDAQAVVEADKEALSVAEETTENIILPKTGASNKTSVVWSSSDTDVIANDGTVFRGVSDETVKLTATLTYGTKTDIREFYVTVKALTSEELLTKAEELISDGITVSQWNEDYTDFLDTNIVNALQRIISESVTSVTAESIVSTDDTSVVATDGSITYALTEKNTNVTLTLKCGDETKDITVLVTVPEKTETRQNFFNSVADNLENIIKKNNESLDNVTGNLSIQNMIETYTYAEWTIPAEAKKYLSGSGTVTRPDYGSEDFSFKLGCKFSWYSMLESYMPSGYVGPVPKEKNLEFDITIKAYTQDEYNMGKSDVDSALSAFSEDKITLFSDKITVADLEAVKEHLMLPDVTGFVNSTDWKSSDEAVIKSPSYGTGRAQVIRPAVGAEPTSTVLTVYLTKNSYTGSKTFDVTVAPLTNEEIEEVNAKVKKVADSLTFDIIANKNSFASGVTQTLNLYKSASLNGDEISWSKSASPITGYKIEWSYSVDGIIGSYGAITRPDSDTDVKMTATVTDVERSYASPYTSEIDITVPGKEMTPEDGLLSAIAKSYKDIKKGENDTQYEWKIMEMGAYEDYNPATDSKLTDTAKQDFVNLAVKNILSEEAGEADYAKYILGLRASGIDPEKLYNVNSNTSFNALDNLKSLDSYSSSVWTAPFTLAALNQGEYDTSDIEKKIVDSLLNSQKNDGSWDEWGTIQTTANAIAGLSFYYDSDEKVKTAIDKGIEYLSSVQLENGKYNDGYGEDSNTLSIVITGLSAMGINTDTDERFIKNKTSLYDAFLSYVLTDGAGFGYADNITYDNYSTEQGFRALIAAKTVMNTGERYNIYDFSHKPTKAGRATDSGNDSTTPPDSDGSSSKIKVTFTLKGDKSYWIDEKTVSVNKNSTVLDVFKKAMEGTGIEYINKNGYISSITKGNKTLSEFSDGPNSGWLYKLNNKVPGTGISEQKVSAGDEIVFYFTEDWTMDKDASKGGIQNLGGSNSSVSSGNENKTEPITQRFTDIDSHWAKESINFVTEKGYMKGTKEDKFEPDLCLDRGMLITILFRYAGEPEINPEAELPFKDVSTNEYYCNAIIWGVENDIIKGTDDNSFEPESLVDREQLIVMLCRYFKGVGNGEIPGEFEDSALISDWAKEAVSWGISNNIIKGKTLNTINPKDYTTRAEIAEIIKRLNK